MASTIELEGYEEFEEYVKNMALDTVIKRQAVRSGIKVIGKGLENDTPKGPTGELAEIKVSVKENALATEGTAKSKAFYDIFQEYGTSEQKAHVGYFERSVEENTEEAISKATTELTDDDQLNMVPYILIAQQDLYNFLGNSVISGGINFMNTPCIFHQSALFNISPRFKGGFTILKSDDSLLNIYHAKNSIYIESNLTLPTGGSFYGGGLYGGDITSIGYTLNGKYKDVIKLYSNIQQIDFLRPLNMNGFGIYNATIAASYSLNSTSPGRSVGADTASVETMLLQEDFSKYDEENHSVIVNINEAVKSIYEKNKILEDENEKLKQDKENLTKELDMTKNVVDNLLMGVS